MGMFDFLGDIASAAVKVVLTPVAIVKDVVTLEPFESTKDLLSSAVEDVEEAFDDLFD